MSPRTRPGPLQEMDLRLVPVPTPYATPSHSRPNKRPHSPSVGSFDSPAKRRLKAEGTLNTPRLKSPLSASSNSARFAPAHFHALLQGPDSPAVRLDFGLSEASDSTVYEAPRNSGGGSGTPRRSPKRTPSTRVRRSPRFAARTPGSPSRSTGSISHGQTGAEADSAAIRASRASPILIPREVSPPDRQSVHYPGFDVYQDPYVVIPVARKSSAEDEEAALSTSDKEHDKENRAPRRKSSKKTTEPATPSETAWLKAGLASPSFSAKSSGKKPVPPSPHPKHVMNYLAILATPRERTLCPVVSPAATLVGATPGRTLLGKEERRQMRRAMEEEMDFVDGEDELM